MTCCVFEYSCSIWKDQELRMLAFVQFVPQQKCLQCCHSATWPGSMQQCSQQRQSQISDEHCCHTHPTILTSYHQIIICLVLVKTKSLRADHYTINWVLQNTVRQWRHCRTPCASAGTATTPGAHTCRLLRQWRHSNNTGRAYMSC